MYGSKQGGVLSGLTKRTGDAGAFGKGRAFAAQAGLGMDQAIKEQELGVQQMRDDSQLRQQDSRNKSDKAMNNAEARLQKGALASRKAVFDTTMNFDYAALNRRQYMQRRQSLLNNLARYF